MMGYGYRYGNNMMGYGYRYGNNMMGGGWVGIIIPLIIIVIVVAIIYKLLQNRNITSNSNNIGYSDNSLDILNERFARGEIDEDEYSRKKELLLNHKKR